MIEKKSNIDISIVIVNWNAKSLLRDCLKSIYETTKPFSIEILVIDNGSTDGSIKMIKSHFPHVKLIENENNLGFAKANNIGINKCRGKYVCLVNSDIVVRKRCFENLFNYMGEHLDVGMSGPQLLNTDLTIQVSCKQFPSLWNNVSRTFFLHRLFPKSSLFGAEEMSYFNHKSILNVDALAGAFLMVRNDTLKHVGVLDEDFFIYSEDIDWCKRFSDNGWEIIFYPKANAIHHDGGSSKRAPIRFYIEMLKAKLHYWEKHHSFIDTILIHLIMLIQHAIRLSINFIIYTIIPRKRQEKNQEIQGGIKALGLIGNSFRDLL